MDGVAGDRLAVGPVAGIIGRLAATGLGFGDLDLEAGLLDELGGGETDGWAEKIDQAGHEQGDTLALRGRRHTQFDPSVVSSLTVKVLRVATVFGNRT